MKKIAIIVDSFCGQDKKTVESKENFFYIPLIVSLDGKDYAEGIDLDTRELLSISYKASDAKTSQPSPVVVTDLYDKLSKEYEHVIHFPTSGSVSGTSRTAMMLSKEYDNVHVVDQILVGDTSIIVGKRAIELYEKGITIDEVLKEVREQGMQFPSYVVPMTNDAIIRGGRLGRASAAILKKLKTVPIIGFEDDQKLHRKMIKRSGDKAIRWAIEKIVKDFPNEYKTEQWLICHNEDLSQVKIAKEILKEFGVTDIVTQYTCAMIAVHTGDGAISIGLRRK